MNGDGSDGRRSLGGLLREELQLAKLEITSAVAGIGTGTALTATGAVFVLLGGLALLTGLALLIGDQWLPADRYWLAALLLLVVTGALAAWFVKRGMAQLSPSKLTPQETLTTLKEDKEWLKQRLTSGATS
jgi:drug/metabolite transporter (DMT)-like permease